MSGGEGHISTSSEPRPMPKRPPPSVRREPSNITGGGDRYAALAEILEQAEANASRAREVEEREAAQRARRESVVPVWLVVVLALAAAWLWLTPPTVLRADPVPPQPLEREEAALRLAMYVQVQRIRAFERERERLPETLAEAGPPLPAMEYHRLTDGLFQLNGTTDRIRLTYRSDLPLDELITAGAGIMGRGGSP